MATDKNKSSSKSTNRASDVANKDVLDFTKKIYESLSNQKDSQDKINDAIKESSIYYKDLSNSATQVQNSFKNIFKVLEDTSDKSEEYLKNIEDVKDTMDSYADLLEDVVENTKNLGSLSYKRIKTDELLNKLESTQAALIEKQNKFLEDGNGEAAGILETNKQNVKTLIAQAKQLKRAAQLQDVVNKKLKEAGTSVEDMTDEITEFGDGVLDAFKKIPGGSTLSKMLGFGKIQKEFKEKVGGAITKSLMDSAAAGKNGMSSMFGAMIAGARAFTAAMLANPIFLIAAAIVAIILIFKKLLDIAYKVDEEVTDIAKSFNVSKDRAKELKHEMLAIGITSAELVVDLTTINEAFGDMNARLLQVNERGFKTAISNAQQLTYGMQLSTEEAANFQNMLALSDTDAFNPDKSIKFTQALSDGTKEVSHGMAEVMAATESVNDSLGLVGDKRQSLKSVVSELSKISKSTLAMFRGSVKELVKATMQMKLLGTSADTMAKVASGLLDVESSISKEYEDRALTGSTINYDQLRFMSLTAKTQKDLANMATFMYNEMDKQTLKWEDMTHWQKEARADALKMSVEEVDGMYQQGKLLKMLGEKEGERIQQAIKEGKLLESDVATLKQKDAALAASLLKESETISLKQKQDHIMAVMTEKIDANLDGLGNFVSSLADIGNRLASGESLWSVMTSGGVDTLSGKATENAEMNKGLNIEEQIKRTGTEDQKKELEARIKENTSGSNIFMQQAINMIAHPITTWFESSIKRQERAKKQLESEAARDYAAELEQRNSESKGQKVDDAYFSAGSAQVIMGKDGEFYYPNRNDNVLVTTNEIKPTRVNTMTSDSVTTSSSTKESSETISLLKEQNKLLASLLGAVDQPVKLNLNGIDREIGNMQSLRKNYGGRISNSYGATHGF